MSLKNEKELFIHKYQSTCLNDFLMEPQMIEILKTLLKIDHINILFIGKSGSGKTTLLNIIVNEYYKNIPEKELENNILSISSLKEQGVQYYRNEVKIFCQTKSSIKNKKKMVVIDDIDALNEQGQQIFRNYMDKYSVNVNFLVSSYSIQKVLENLQSRFTIIQLKPLSNENMTFILDKIKKKENIVLEKDAEEFLINISNYNAKTLIHYMEKFKLLGEPIIGLEIVQQLCTSVNFIVFEKYILMAKDGLLKEAVKLMYDIYDKGYTVMDILDCFFLFIKTTALLCEKEKYCFIPIICKYITVFHTVHEDEIELALFTNEIMGIFI